MQKLYRTAFTMADRRSSRLLNWMTSSRLAFTMAGAGQRASLFGWLVCGHVAFTMAEILLSLTIIGVVAAITLPSLTGNINERTWNTQRKALYSRISQAISLMPALNGYGTFRAESSEGATDGVDNVAETFLTSGLAKVLKINNICDNAHLADCGIVTSFTNMAGSRIKMPETLHELNSYFKKVEYSGFSFSANDTKAVAFETQNGESVITYYNNICRTEYLNQEAITTLGNVFGFAEANMCVNFVYDLNGKKGPNTVGKDIGIITVFNAVDSNVVAPMPISAKYNDASETWYNASKRCTTIDSEARLPNVDELTALYINRDIVNMSKSMAYWSGTPYNTERAWNVGAFDGHGGRRTYDKGYVEHIRCIKR